MSLLADALAATKQIVLVTEEIKRVSEEGKTLARTVTDHEHRLIRIETKIEMAQQGTRRTLAGK